MEQLLLFGKCYCARFLAEGECVHMLPQFVPNGNIGNKSYTKLYEEMRKEKAEKVVKKHKFTERAGAKWELIAAKDWKTLPFTFGVYLWLNEADRMIFYGKAVDLRRRHFSWHTAIPDLRVVESRKIWWLHTGWYVEIMNELGKLGKYPLIERETLEKILSKVKPLLLPEPPSGR